MLLVVAMLAVAAAGCGGDDDEAGGTGATTGEATGEAGGTLVFAGAADPVALDGALVSDGESIRAITQIFETLVALKPGTTEAEPGLAESWSADDDRQRLDVQDPRRGDVPRRRDARRRGGLLQLRPLVQLQGPAPEPGRDLLLAGRLRRLRHLQQGQRRAGGQPLQELRGDRRDHCGPDADQAVGDVHPGALAAGVLDRQPEGADGVQGRRGHHRRRRRLHPDRHVRHRASDRHGPVQVRLVDPQRPAHAGQERGLLGRQVEDRQADHPADRRQRRTSAGAADRRDPGLRPGRAAGHRHDRGRRRPADHRPARLQRRLRRLQRREEADRRHQGARGDRVRPRPAGGRGQLLLRPRRAWRRSSCRRRSSATRTTCRSTPTTRRRRSRS